MTDFVNVYGTMHQTRENVAVDPYEIPDTAPIVPKSQSVHSIENGNNNRVGEAGTHSALPEDQEHGYETDTAPTIDIVINNVVCSFGTRCHLNLKRIATEGINVIYRRESGMVNMKIRRPACTASIWSSGKVTCTGATSEENAKAAGRKVARSLQRLGFKVRFCNFRIVNVLGTCSLPFGIRITHFSRDHKENASYEPELHPGVTYRIKSPRATLKIFSTGSITITAPSVENVQSAVEHIFPLVFNYKMDEPDLPPGGLHMMPKHRHPQRRRQYYDYDSDELSEDEEEYGSSAEDEFDSDEN